MNYSQIFFLNEGTKNNTTGRQKRTSFDKKGERSHFPAAISSKENKHEAYQKPNMRSKGVKKEEASEIILPLP